jgi:hypothetical protein
MNPRERCRIKLSPLGNITRNISNSPLWTGLQAAFPPIMLVQYRCNLESDIKSQHGKYAYDGLTFNHIDIE